MKRIAGALLMFAAVSVLAGWAVRAQAEESLSPDDILGEWTTEKDDSIFQFYREGDRYFGRIVWQREPLYPPGDREAGKPKHDRENPDPDLRDKPLEGLTFLKDFRFKEKKWTGGTIYDPTAGTTYKCQLRIEDGSLRVHGYIGIPLLGRTVVWHRPGPELKALAASTANPPATPAP